MTPGAPKMEMEESSPWWAAPRRRQVLQLSASSLERGAPGRSQEAQEARPRVVAQLARHASRALEHVVSTHDTHSALGGG